MLPRNEKFMSHKYKIKEKVYVLNGYYKSYSKKYREKYYPGCEKHLVRTRFSEKYDIIGIIIGYVESSTLINENYKIYYLKNGYEYVLGVFDSEENIDDIFVIKEKDLRLYHGHEYQASYYYYSTYLNEEIKKREKVSSLRRILPLDYYSNYIKVD